MRTRILAFAVVAVVGVVGVRMLVADEDLPLAEIMECRRPRVAPPAPVTAGPDVAARLAPVAAVEGAIGMAPLPDRVHALVVARAGEVWRVDLRSGAADQVLDLTGRVLVGSEGGLLAVAVDPDGRYAYLHFTDRAGTSRVVEYRLDGATVVAGSEREVVSLEHPEQVHNGGAMHFGPDGALYVGFGNGGNRESDTQRGAERDRLDGKLLRILPRPDGADPYGVPGDNPFAGERGARPEIWAEGLRNPWQFSFDPATGDLWVADVGSSCYEEVDVLPAGEGGADLGFPKFEGFHAFREEEADGSTFPVYAYRHGPTACAVIGGVVYRGAGLPGLDGAYLFADFCGGPVRWLRRSAGAVEVGAVTVTVPRIQSFARDLDGGVYVLSAEAGLLRLHAP